MKILVVSDIHANIDALEAVFAAEARSCTGLFCLGDITGYGPDPEECVRAVRRAASTFEPYIVLAGNHDAAVSDRIPSEWFNKGAQFSVAYAKKTLSAEAKEWLEGLPSSIDYSKSTVLSHGSPVEPLTGYLFGGMETILALSWLADRDGTLCFCGHTHEASVFSGWTKERAANRTRAPSPGTVVSVAHGPIIVNPGSTGFPRAFNGGRTADMPGESLAISESSFPAYYAVWDTEEKTVTFRDVRYDRRPLEDRIDKMQL